MVGYEKALKWREEVLKIQENVQCNSLDCATTYINFGEIFHEMKDNRAALEYLQCGVKIRQEKLPSRYPDLVTSYYKLSKLYIATRNSNLTLRNV